MRGPRTILPPSLPPSGGLAAAGAGLSHRGLVRESNEDAILIDPAGALWAVADGMGGHGHGDLAADLVIDAFARMPHGGGGRGALQQAFDAAHAEVRRRARAEGLGEIGATAVALLIEGGHGTVAWAGDSRAYRLRGGALERLTRDHSLVQELIDRGELDEAGAEGHPQGHVVTRAVGAGERVAPAFAELELAVGEVVLLCSDGLTRCVPEAEIAAVLARVADPAAACRALVERALAAGGARQRLGGGDSDRRGGAVKAPGLMGAVVIGASLVLAAIAFALVSEVLRGAGGTATDAALVRLEREGAGQAARIAALETALAELRRGQEGLEERLAAGGGTPPAPAPLPEAAPLPMDQFGGDAAAPGNEGLADPMQLAKGRFNQSVLRPTPQLMRELLGEPRASYSDQCQPVTNPRLIAALETRQVGGFKVTMLKPALDSFQAVMERLKAEEPEIHAALGTAGALCARHVRGAPGTPSSHAWGAAVDLTLTGDLDAMGDDATQFGLVVLAEFFNDAGWYWGAGYGREDSMHFEVGEALLRRWVADGRM